MVAYAIPRDRAQAIAEGTQRFMLMSPRGTAARHARIGEPITLRPGGAEVEKPVAAVCVARATVHIAATGVRRVLHEFRLGMGQGSSDASLILAKVIAAEQGHPDATAGAQAVAESLGFADWSELWRATIRDARGRGELPGGVYVRELVGWRLAT